MAYERPKGSGRWYSHIDRRRIKDATNKAQALDYEAWQRNQRFNEKVRGIKSAPPVKFREFSELYLKNYSAVEKPRSHATDVHNLVSINEFFGDMLLTEIQPAMLFQFKAKQIAEGLTANTAHHKLHLISSIFKYAITTKALYGENPVKNGPKLKQLKDARVRFFDETEMAKLYAGSTGELHNLIRFAVNTGMRLGEIMRLTWRDIDINRNLIYVDITKADIPRQIPINSEVKALLMSMRKLPNSEQLFSCDHDIGYRNLLTRLKLKDNATCFHTLRHTFASNLAMRGVDLYTISKLLGHSTTKMTQRYAHLAPNYLQNSIERLVTYTNPTHELSEAKSELMESKQLQAVKAA